MLAIDAAGLRQTTHERRCPVGSESTYLPTRYVAARRHSGRPNARVATRSSLLPANWTARHPLRYLGARIRAERLPDDDFSA